MRLELEQGERLTCNVLEGQWPGDLDVDDLDGTGFKIDRSLRVTHCFPGGCDGLGVPKKLLFVFEVGRSSDNTPRSCYGLRMPGITGLKGTLS
jgi:hypothetical protein